jgi:hypothetical protein
MALGDRGEHSREYRNPILFERRAATATLVQEWYYRSPEMSSKLLNGRAPHAYCPATPCRYLSRMTESLTDPLPELERAVKDCPEDAKAIVALANHYWLIGAGPEVVGDLASRAIASDPENRAAWHLWALAESNPRERLTRWQQVSRRFPQDDLARVNLADNAASLAGAEHDYDAVDLAIVTYEELLATAQQPDQRAALEKAIRTLKGWKF